MESDQPPTELMAITVSVAPSRHSSASRGEMIETFLDNARAAGLDSVIAPVRPTLTERHPLIAIERYLEWRRDDGLHFDPWLRIHEHVGGEIVAPARVDDDHRPGRDLGIVDGYGVAGRRHVRLPGRARPNVWVLHRV